MGWDNAVLSTPASIAAFEKEINTITRAAEEHVFYDGTATKPVTSEAYYVREVRGFGVIRIALTDTEASLDKDVTVVLSHSDTDDGTYHEFVTYILPQATYGPSFEFDVVLPVSCRDYIKVKTSTTAKLRVTLRSAWAEKHKLAKSFIANYVRTFYSGDLDDLDSYTPLEIPASYYVLHLIYADLMLGFGENEIYKHKMQFYYRQFDKLIKFAIRQLTKSGSSISTSPVIAR